VWTLPPSILKFSFFQWSDLGHTAIGFVAVEYNINLPRALCTLLVFWRIFDSIVLGDFQSIIQIYLCCALPPTLYTLFLFFADFLLNGQDHQELALASKAPDLYLVIKRHGKSACVLSIGRIFAAILVHELICRAALSICNQGWREIKKIIIIITFCIICMYI
jgi:hypothetical protein